MTFLEDVHGPNGKIAFVVASKAGPLANQWADAADEASVRAALIRAVDENTAGADLYFTPGQYAGQIVRRASREDVGKLSRGRGRKRVNVPTLRSFWVDIDAGEAKAAKSPGKVYATKTEALKALDASLTSMPALPPPTYVVDSGAGVHAYWCLSEDVPYSQWLPAAVRLRDALRLSGLNLDPSRSKDAASIMRMPDSIHWGETKRTGKTVRAHLLGGGRFGEVYDPVPFYTAVGKLPKTEDPRASTPKPAPRPTPGTVRIGPFKIPSSALEASLERSARADLPPATDYNIKLVWRALQEMGSDLAYEEWRNVIWALKATEWDEAWDLACMWSELSDAAWETPWEDALRKVWDSDQGAGSGVGVGSLVHHIRTALGDEELRFLDEGEDEELAEPKRGEQVVRAHDARTHTTTEYVLPELTKDYRRKESEPGIWARSLVDMNGDEEVWDWVKFVDIDVFVSDRVELPGGDCRLAVTKIEPHSGPVTFDFEMKHLVSPVDTAKALAERSIIPNGKRGKDIMSKYLEEQAKSLIQTKSTTKKLQSMGWHGASDERSFALGGSEYLPGGKQRPVQFADAVEPLAQSTLPTGTAAGWSSVAALYDGPDYAPAQAMILLTMGAPLSVFTGEIGGIVNLHSAASGLGKSAILETALSVWSGVKDTSVARSLMVSEFTPMAVEHLLTYANSLPVGLDELTPKITGDSRNNRNQASLREFIYNSTQGRSKLRLKSSADGFREAGTWDTFLLATANAPLEAVFAADPNMSGEAERARTLDIDGNSLPRIQDFAAAGISQEEIVRRRHLLKVVLAENYAVPGHMLLKEYMADHDAMRQRVGEKFAQYQSQFGMRDRFAVAKLAVARVAWEVAKELGLVTWKWKPVEKVIVKAITTQHEASAAAPTADGEGIFAEFLSTISEQILTVRDEAGLTDGRYGQQTIRGQLLGRWETENNLIWIRRSAVRKHCADSRVPANSIEEHLKSIGALIDDDDRKNLGRGFRPEQRQRCLRVDAAKIGLLAGTANTTEGDEDDD